MTCKVMTFEVAPWLMVAPSIFEVMTCKVMTFEVAHWLMVARSIFEVMTCKVMTFEVAHWLMVARSRSRPHIARPGTQPSTGEAPQCGGDFS
jgi:hypothetical protein